MNLEEFKDSIYNLPKAEKREIYVGKDFEEVKRRIATWNVTDDNLAEIVSDQYKIVQHENFFSELVKAVEKLPFETKNCILKDEREVVYAEVIFERELAEEGILTGLRAGNSFDKTCRAFVEIYALREVCTNGMLGKELFGRAGKLHVGSIEARDLMDSFKKNLPEAEDTLRKVKIGAEEDTVSVNDFPLEEMLRELGFGVGHREYVLDRLSSNETNRWELYNNGTEYIEHEMNRSESGREKIHRKANQLLTSSFKNLEKRIEAL